MIGQTLGHYRIEAKLGEGGMGVVYKAHDTHLDRFVAIKVLPPERVADPERKRRFVQEAKAASALNHPNIVVVHDITSDAGCDFIVMEYIAGKTLEQLIARKGLGLPQTLKCAVQIADALAKAHAKGIVHRDLKPTNIMVTEDGLVKVLDFGLAKLTEPRGPEDATVTARTAEGVIVGTVAYMSPEQAEGKPVDARSDVFSFGSVLYEMITGRRAFHGDTKLSVLSALLRAEPTPVSQLAVGVPAELERVIARCLRKEPERRFQHMDDLRVALAELKEESDSGRLAPSPGAPPMQRRRWVLALSLLAAAALLATVAVLKFARPGTTPRPSPPAVVPLTSYAGIEDYPTFSPDGRQVAFSWDGEKQDNFDIYVKLIGSDPPLRLTRDPRPDRGPAWSPDGQWIAFVRELERGPGPAELLLVPPLGGLERKLGELHGAGSRPIAWVPDARGLIVADASFAGQPPALFLLSIATGQKRQLTTPPSGSSGDSRPAVSPDGRNLSFARGGSLYVVSLSGDFQPIGEPRPLTWVKRHIGSYAWTPDGREIVFSSQDARGASLWRAAALEPRPPEPLPFGEEGFDPSFASQGRRLAYSRRTYDVDTWRLQVGDSPGASKGESTKLIASTRPDIGAEYSPDGRRIAFLSTRSGAYEIWVCEEDGSNPRMLTSLGGVSPAQLRWSPDGRRIVFAFRGDIYAIDSAGGIPQRLTSDPAVESTPSYSRDGTWVYFTSQRSGQSQIWKLPATGGDPVQLTRTGGGYPVESLDGKSVFYTKRRDGWSGSLCKVPAGGGEETQVLESVQRSANFALVERGIYFMPSQDLDQLSVVQFFDFASGIIRPVAQIPKRERSTAAGLSISSDRRHILYSLYELEMDLMLVENFR